MFNRLNQNLKNITAKYQDLLILVLRISVAVIFIRTGYGKLVHFDKTVMFFESLGIPFTHISALLAACTEFAGGLLILIGLFTRFISFPLAFVMVIAIATAQWREVKDAYDFISLIEYLYLIIFLLFTSLGAGKFSLDALWLDRKNEKGSKKKISNKKK
jgi:putative oxidoreductase